MNPLFTQHPAFALIFLLHKVQKKMAMCLPTSGICPYCDTFFEDFKHHLIFKTNDSVKNSHCDECEFVHPNFSCVSNHSHKVHVETKPENVLKCDIEIEEGGLTYEMEFWYSVICVLFGRENQGIGENVANVIYTNIHRNLGVFVGIIYLNYVNPNLIRHG